MKKYITNIFEKILTFAQSEVLQDKILQEIIKANERCTIQCKQQQIAIVLC